MDSVPQLLLAKHSPKSVFKGRSKILILLHANESDNTDFMKIGIGLLEYKYLIT